MTQHPEHPHPEHPLTASANRRADAIRARLTQHSPDIDLAVRLMLQNDDPLPQRRAGFVRALTFLPLDMQAEAIESACLQIGGDWRIPDLPASMTGSTRPATHMFEIRLLDATGFGASVEEAVRSWMRSAINLAEADWADAPHGDPDTQLGDYAP